MQALRLAPTLTTRERWELYEQEKKRLQAMNLTPGEYEQRIRALCERLGL